MATAVKADPLSVLRHYNVHRLEFEEDYEKVIFGEFVFQKSAKTNFFYYVVSDVGKTKQYYTLGSLLLLLKNRDIPHPQYVRLASALDVPTIRRADRRVALAYLNGEITQTPSIDLYDGPLVIPTLVKRAFNDLKPPAKKIRLAGASSSSSNRFSADPSLTDVLSVEEIAAIKLKVATKRLAKRKKKLMMRRARAIMQAAGSDEPTLIEIE